ncbi:hypothetical protein HDV04_002071 [Boothiomyces sp. JEL0838]|nr:hypothetical protein HDV04_002071 [Boothiomyces sp. JEL0838]
MLLTDRIKNSNLLLDSLKLLEYSIIDVLKLSELQTDSLAKVLSLGLGIADTDDIRLFIVRLILQYTTSELFANEFMKSCNQQSIASIIDTRNLPLRKISIQTVQKLLDSSYRRELVSHNLISILMKSFGHYCYGETSVEWLLLFSKFTAKEELAREFVRRGGLRVLLSMLKIKHLNITFQSILILNNLANFGLIQSKDFSKSSRQQLINFLISVCTKESKSKDIQPTKPSVEGTIKEKGLNILETKPKKTSMTPLITTNIVREILREESYSSSSESLPTLAKQSAFAEPNKTEKQSESRINLQSAKPAEEGILAKTELSKPDKKQTKAKLKSAKKSKPPIPLKKLSEMAKSSMSLKQSVFSLNNKLSEMSVHHLGLEEEYFETLDPKIHIDEELQNLIISLIGSMNSENLMSRIDAIQQLQRILSSSGNSKLKDISVSLCKILCEHLVVRLNEDIRVVIQTCKMLFYLSGKAPMQQVLMECGIIRKLVEIIGGYNLICIEHAIWALIPYCNSARRAKELSELDAIPKLAVLINSGIENIRVYCQTLLKKIAQYGDAHIYKEMDCALMENPWAVVSKKWIDYSPFSPYSKKDQMKFESYIK